MDKISVVVPVYNIAPYLERCVDSISAQNHKNLEIILVDDGSSDNSFEVIKCLASKDSRIIPIHKENGGVTSARFVGVEHATGDWISFIDGDDFIEKDMYERLLENARKYNADISHCGYQMIFPSRTDFYYNTGKIVVQDNEKGIKDLLEAKFIEPGLCNKLYRKSLLQGIKNKMDFSIKNNEDLLMNYFIFKQSNKSIYEDFCPYRYIVRKGSATQKTSSHKIWNPLKVLKIIKSDCEYPSCLPILNGRIAARLVERLVIKEFRKEARTELKLLLPEIRNKKQYLLTYWAYLWPWSYKFVHNVYAKIRGNDRKYRI